MLIKRKIKNVLFGLGVGVMCVSTYAQETDTIAGNNEPQQASVAMQNGDYTRKGADTCAMCHDEDAEFPVYPIYNTRHAQPADERTPFAKLQCETCHGPGAAHARFVQPGEQQAPIISFGADSRLTIRQQNKICLDCHLGQERIAWHGSVHENNDTACGDCHRIHVAHDPVLDVRSQPDVCYQCHKKARSDFLKPSRHPVRYGKMTCSDCHQSHGSTAPAALNQPTVNQTCYRCHAEKRGPVLWEHAPVTEDCGICHNPHGSVQTALLKKRAPLLCQDCHSQFGHPSVPRSRDGLPSGSPSSFLLSRSCLNCHSQIHGSNHPSGVKLMR
jgi:DmsE family decaheme c-type cytochrome